MPHYKSIIAAQKKLIQMFINAKLRVNFNRHGIC